MMRADSATGALAQFSPDQRRRAMMLIGFVILAPARVATATSNTTSGVVAPEVGWHRIQRAQGDLDVGMFAGFDDEDLREVLQHQPIRVTEGFGGVGQGAAIAASLAAARHVRHCPGPYSGWISILATSKANMRLGRASEAEAKVFGIIKPHASRAPVLCGLGMYVDDQLGDMLHVTVISVSVPASHRLVFPLYSEPWKC
jgi:hypothetical protein